MQAQAESITPEPGRQPAYTATYSPEDNKLRLYSVSRLDGETYARVKAAGFIWAPKQGLFVAPAWTPARADLLQELCGEIGDEDSSLADRAEERAERFGEYQEKRAADAERAREAVAAIADNIPLGQPILVGHHSERHARKDAERIESGMRRAVKMWETAQYWQSRAAGAIRHAKYKELPSVRARRIKGLEADLRKQKKNKAECESWLRRWGAMSDDAKWKKTAADGAVSVPPVIERARHLANAGYLYVVERWTAWDVLRPDEERYNGCPSWTPEQVQARALEVYAGSLVYAERWIAHLENRLAYERAMLAEAGGTIAERKGPEVGGGVRCWASPGHGRGWSYVQKVNKVSVTVLDNWGNGGGNFPRTIAFDKLNGVMSKADVEAARAAGTLAETADKTGFYLTAEPPQPMPAPKAEEPAAPAFEAMRESLKAGVTVAAVPQLFPTPPNLAARMVELADIRDGHRILEPSAGTGNILKAIGKTRRECTAVAVEINYALAEKLRALFMVNVEVRCADFLELKPEEFWRVDRVLMNPPFANAQDIAHIEHALKFLRPSGRLVAICANGPRQQERLKPRARSWEALPAGTFAGTGVNAALIVMGEG